MVPIAFCLREVRFGGNQSGYDVLSRSRRPKKKGVCGCCIPPQMGRCSDVRGECRHVLPYRTSGRNVNCIREDHIRAHHANPIAVEANVTSVGLDSDDPSIEATLPHIRIMAATYGRLPDKMQIAWFQPAARLWEGSSKFLS